MATRQIEEMITQRRLYFSHPAVLAVLLAVLDPQTRDDGVRLEVGLVAVLRLQLREFKRFQLVV